MSAEGVRVVEDPPVMARDVQVEKLYQACCYRPGCRRVSEPTNRRADADKWRRDHLEWHRHNVPPGHVTLFPRVDLGNDPEPGDCAP